MLHLSALHHLGEWELVFAGYLTYSEVWGKHPGGLSEEEVTEARFAYEEWGRLQKAYEKWEESHKEPFDRVGYIHKRAQEIVDQV